jgi:hypothetical protein
MKECFMVICLGDKLFREKHLRKNLLEALRHFDYFNIIIADDLDIWNGLLKGYSVEQSKEFVAWRSKHWRDHYLKVLDSYLGSNKLVKSWSEITNNPDFQVIHKAIKSKYRECPKVQARFDEYAQKHLHRLMLRGHKFNISMDLAHAYCVSYQIEQYAALANLYKKKPIPEFYPGFCIKEPDFFGENLQIPEVFC